MSEKVTTLRQQVLAALDAKKPKEEKTAATVVRRPVITAEDTKPAEPTAEDMGKLPGQQLSEGQEEKKPEETKPAETTPPAEVKPAEDTGKAPCATEETKPEEEKKPEETKPVESEEETVKAFASLKEDAEMLLMGASTAPAWYVFGDGRPVAVIRQAAQEYHGKDAKLDAYFTTEAYGKSLYDAAQEVGWPKVLANAKGEVFREKAFPLPRTASEQEIKSQLMTEFTNVAGMVWGMMSKNYLDHPLKDALFEAMAAKGVSNPIEIIEAAFSVAGSTFLPFIIDQTSAYMKLDKSARSQLESVFNGLATRIPSAAADASELARTLEANSISLTTGGGSTPQDRREHIKSLVKKD